jgi:hypothetical protein
MELQNGTTGGEQTAAGFALRGLTMVAKTVSRSVLGSCARLASRSCIKLRIQTKTRHTVQLRSGDMSWQNHSAPDCRPHTTVAERDKGDVMKFCRLMKGANG